MLTSPEHLPTTDHLLTLASDGDDKPRNRNDRNGDRRGYKNDRGGKGNWHNKGRNTFNHYNKKTNNVKSRYDHQEVTDDPVQIRKQVEFYFSDTNLRQDKFLFERIEGHANKPIDIKTIHSFKRMQRYQPYSAVVKALKESDELDVINGDSVGNEQVVRKVALPEDIGTNMREVAANYESESMKRSIYAKGFGRETEKTQLKIEKLFEPYAPKAVRLRRMQDGFFKGSVFVEFSTEEEATDFMEMENKPTFENELNQKVELKWMSKTAYCKEKDELINSGKIRPNDEDDQPRGYGGRGNFRGNRGRDGGRGGRDWRGGRGRDGKFNRRDRNRSGSRERSGERDLRNDNWKELAEKDRKRGRGEEKEKEEKKEVQEFDDMSVVSSLINGRKVLTRASGIPKIKASEPVAGKKRPAEEEGAGGEAKKAKEE